MPPTLQQAPTDPCLCRRLLDTHRQVSCGVTVPFSWVLVHKVLLCPPRVSVLYKFWKLYSGVNGDLLQGDLILTHEEPKPPHCVKKRLHFRVLRKESLEIPWPHPTTCEPIRSQIRISWLYIRDLWPAQEIRIKPGKWEPSRTRGQPGKWKPIRPNPSTEGNQLDVSQPGNSSFSNFSRENTLYKQCNPGFRAPLLSHCFGNSGSPSSSLVIKTLLPLHLIRLPGGHQEISRLGHNTSLLLPYK